MTDLSDRITPSSSEPWLSSSLATVQEASLRGRIVTLLTPFFAIAAGWVAGAVASYVPGVHLDQSQITAFMVTAATAALSAAWRWLQGWQQHELLVSKGVVTPVKAAPVTVGTAS